ncbi:MAG: PolC-type DNA polymerase III [Clostridiales bacterium]|nr:PolC-type DNA polymerase III [Clostridiales bacterium]
MKYKLYKEKAERKDNSGEKRIELHMRTNMSQYDGVPSAGTLISRAAQFGHKAVTVTDNGVVQAFPGAYRSAREMAENGKPIKIIYGMEANFYYQSPEEHFNIVLLAKNYTGLKNLYKLVSWSHIENLHDKTPYITKEKLSEFRKGIIVGDSGVTGELYRAISNEKPFDELCKIARFYDYLEIHPVDVVLSFDKSGLDAETIRKITHTVIHIGEELNIPVCATGNASFCDPEDEIYRRILRHGNGCETADDSAPLFLRTTEEMLSEFAYLGEEKSQEVVVTNPNRIADMVDDLQPITLGLYPPYIDGADEELKSCVYLRAKDIYGDPLPKIVNDRIELELKSIIDYDFAVYYVIAKRLVEDSEAHGYHVGSRGSVGSSLVAFLAGITEVNPLPPHYICPKCKHTEFFTDGTVGSGYDFPAKNCPVCAEKMKDDGHKIPFESFASLYGDKVPDIDLNFASEYQQSAQNYLRSMFGEDHVFFASTVSTFSDRHALPLIHKYAQDKNLSLSEKEVILLTQGISGAKRTTGCHPGGLLIVPDEFDAEDFTPLQYIANDKENGKISSHFDFHDIRDTCLKMDILGHNVQDMIHHLEKNTGVKIDDIPMNDPAVYSLFTSPDALGVTAEEIDCDTGTLSLPELGTPFVRQMLKICQPKNFSELIKISALSHGTNVWTDNAQDLIKEGICSISEVVATRDDVMNDLTDKEIDIKTAFRIMEIVRKGKGNRMLKDEHIIMMREHGMPQWYIDSLKKIRYMFPKAHAAAYMTNAVRLGWYKLYYPNEYYQTYMDVCKNCLDDEEIGAILKEAKCRGVKVCTHFENSKI